MAVPRDAELLDRRVLVIGGGTGIGRATVLLAARRGARIAWTVLEKSEIGPLAEVAPALAAMPLDVQDRMALGPTLDSLVGHIGGLDTVIYCAGILVRTPAETMSDDDWDKLLDINLSGCFRAVRHLIAPLRKSAAAPSIVVISSQLGIVGARNQAAYAASKSGLNGLVRSLALELAPEGIRVNAVGPGPTATAMSERTRADPALLRDMLAMIPMGRYGEPDEIANVALFLASERASFVTGQLWCADGGFVAR